MRIYYFLIFCIFTINLSCKSSNEHRIQEVCDTLYKNTNENILFLKETYSADTIFYKIIENRLSQYDHFQLIKNNPTFKSCQKRKILPEELQIDTEEQWVTCTFELCEFSNNYSILHIDVAGSEWYEEYQYYLEGDQILLVDYQIGRTRCFVEYHFVFDQQKIIKTVVRTDGCDGFKNEKSMYLENENITDQLNEKITQLYFQINRLITRQ